MKLYPKKLRNLEELKRERLALKKAIAASSPTDIFGTEKTGKRSPAKKIADEAEEDVENANDMFATVVDFLTSKGSMNMALSLATPLLSLLGRKVGKSFVKPLAKELLGGYVKWKLIEISYKTALRFIRSKQHKHQSKKS